MSHIKGIGGVFFKSKDPAKLCEWYKENLGIKIADEFPGAMFFWREVSDPQQCTVWSPFPADTKYFEPSTQPFMINYVVDDLDALLAELRAKGVKVDDRVEDTPQGRFGWAMDPEGNRLELWQPPKA
jgi:predicted enzyme related to lactoylglutathione lyase